MPINGFLYPGAKFTPPYEVANSLRFNDGDSAYMNRTLGTPTDPEKWTWSCWVKRSTLGATQDFMSYDSGSTLQENFAFNSDDNLRWYHRTSGGTVYHLKTNRKFRDVSAWYHLLVVYDSSQATDSNRVKFFVNGTQETSFGTSDYPAQDVDSELNKANAISLYRWAGGSEYFDGYIAENVFCDGQALDPTSFGEFDSDTNIWKPIDVSGLTFGTNGFHLDFENSGSLGADVSGNSNNFTVNNLTSVDQSTDTCTNNFATFNSLDNYWQGNTYSEGNLKTVTGTTPYNYNSSTIGMSSGKWYCEVKMTAHSETDGNNYSMIGITSKLTTSATDHLGQNASDYRYYGRDGTIRNNGSDSSYGNSYGVGDIIGIAIDLDNNKLYFSKNGTFQNSGDPTSGSTGTGAISITASASTPIGAYFIAVGYYDGSDTGTFEFNTGNPSFSISSGNSDGNGYGNFEYAVPSGYYAINTKNLAEFG